MGGRPWLLEANWRPSLLVDEVHPLPVGQSRADVNRLIAEDKKGCGGSKWGRVCRCSMHPSVHQHQLCPIDVAAKSPAVEGALMIAQRARAGRTDDVASWAEGTTYRLV